ncbi:hypothetical protein Dsin_009051 [Dipteronia sinensis]|uniref:No apical meristem-associated C-terminal domain-containing protein n=1 Tax=Dipteronia sinensis TaxID=43782 RepID=A0AAE0APS4_9ROSI|nr:hypothetical protein Dsin_009051 [Dipteronia sinensis]
MTSNQRSSSYTNGEDSRLCHLNQAKTLLTQDKNYKKGFKFDHVWLILKDTEKFADNANSATSAFQKQSGNFVSSQSHTPTSKSPTSATSRQSSFSLKISDKEIGSSSAERLIWVKNAKFIVVKKRNFGPRSRPTS